MKATPVVRNRQLCHPSNDFENRIQAQMFCFHELPVIYLPGPKKCSSETKLKFCIGGRNGNSEHVYRLFTALFSVYRHIPRK